MNISIIERNFDLPRMITEIARHGATSVRAVSEDVRSLLAAEARGYTYDAQPEYLPSGVREQLTIARGLNPTGHCIRVGRLIEQRIETAARFLPSYPFITSFRFGDFVVQRYAAGSTGISPHRDFSDRINLVCVLILEGRGRFCICDDRAGSNPREIRGEPGDLILMRGPGFLGSAVRPMHFVDRIETERFALGMRCVK